MSTVTDQMGALESGVPPTDIATPVETIAAPAKADPPLSGALTAMKCQQLELAWQDVELEVPKQGQSWKGPKEMKKILKGLTGVLHAGEFLAIIGASGCGKTTFLNVLAGHTAVTKGEVVVNGKPMTRTDKHTIAYVAQEDYLMPTCTVLDTLRLSAELRLPKTHTRAEKDKMVEEVLAQFRLSKCRNTLVGTADEMMRGVSGGERKRLSIAVELISNPSLILLDEPTSGLDSKMARDVCRMLKRLTGNGRTCVASIHQPSSEVFAEFDKLLILSEGHTVYFGKAQDAVSYFTKIDPVALKCPVNYNPADFFMALTYDAVDVTDDTIVTETPWSVSKLSAAYDGELGSSMRSAVKQHMATQSEGILPRAEGVGASTWTTVTLLSRRAFQNMSRSPMLFFARIVQTVFINLIILIVYGKLEDTAEGIQSRNGVFFFVAVNQLMMAVMSIIVAFPSERGAFVRENRAGMYSALSYFVTKVGVELPFQLLFPFIGCIMTWGPLGMKIDFLWYWIFCALLTNVGQAFGMMAGCAFKSAEIAVSVTPMLIMPFMIFGGLLVNFETIPEWLRWLEFVSPVRYAYNGLLELEYANILTLGCQESQKLLRCGPTWMAKEAAGTACCPYATGVAAYNTLGMDDFTYDECAYILLAIYFGCCLIAYGGLVLTSKRA